MLVRVSQGCCAYLDRFGCFSRCCKLLYPAWSSVTVSYKAINSTNNTVIYIYECSSIRNRGLQIQYTCITYFSQLHLVFSQCPGDVEIWVLYLHTVYVIKVLMVSIPWEKLDSRGQRDLGRSVPLMIFHRHSLTMLTKLHPSSIFVLYHRDFFITNARSDR